MAGQADGDRTDHAVSGMRRAPDHEHHALAGAGIADAGRNDDQLVRDEPLAPLELPVRPRPGNCPAASARSSGSSSSNVASISTMASAGSLTVLDR
jgi:hypothetical protein